MADEKGIARQGAFYLFVGVTSALIELGLFELLYAVIGLDIAASNVIAVIVATVYNFLLNRNLTFSSTSNPLYSAIKYGVLLLANMVITTLAISFLVSVGVHSALAKLVMQACVACWNFFLYRAFVFK